MPTFHFFISRASEDREWAKWIAKVLEAEGHTTTLQDFDFRPGHSFLHQMKLAEERANHIIAVLSPYYLAKPFTLNELYSAVADDALAEKRLLIPVRVAECDIPRLIKDLAYVDFVGRDEAACREELLKAIRDPIRAPVAFPGERPGQCRVFVDQSYQQEAWYGEPTVEGGYSSISRVIAEPCCAHSGGYQTDDELNGARVLILPIPFRSEITDSECARIVRWVQRGGGLLLLGFYLMEAHHRNNLNRLMRRFGMEFRLNLVMPSGRESFQECMAQSFALKDRDFWIVSDPVGTPGKHPVLQDVRRVAITSSCTIECADRPALAISTSDEASILHARGYKDPASARLVRLTDYVLDQRGPATYAMALESGRGRIFAVGSWKTFLNIFVDDTSLGNATLLHNILSWLVGT
jgi:hypothetical protein